MQESHTVPRGVLWIIVSISGVIIISLASVTAAVVSNWALMVDRRGIDNASRITALETRFGSIESKLDSIKEMLQTHMGTEDKK